MKIEKTPCFSKLSEVSSRILGVVSKTMEVTRKQNYSDYALDIEKAACFYELSEVSSRILVVVPKTMEFARKQGYYNIGFVIEKLRVSLNYLKSVLEF